MVSFIVTQSSPKPSIFLTPQAPSLAYSWLLSEWKFNPSPFARPNHLWHGETLPGTEHPAGGEHRHSWLIQVGGSFNAFVFSLFPFLFLGLNFIFNYVRALVSVCGHLSAGGSWGPRSVSCHLELEEPHTGPSQEQWELLAPCHLSKHIYDPVLNRWHKFYLWGSFGQECHLSPWEKDDAVFLKSHFLHSSRSLQLECGRDR